MEVDTEKKLCTSHIIIELGSGKHDLCSNLFLPHSSN